MKRLFALLKEGAGLMVGQSSYEAYRSHVERHHPGAAPMSRTEFFRHREAARFGGRGGGKCC